MRLHEIRRSQHLRGCTAIRELVRCRRCLTQMESMQSMRLQSIQRYLDIHTMLTIALCCRTYIIFCESESHHRSDSACDPPIPEGIKYGCSNRKKCARLIVECV